MADVFIVFVADVFHQFAVLLKEEMPGQRERASVGSRVVDGYFVLDRSKVWAAEAFQGVELLGMRKAAVAEPKLFIETSRIHDQRIAFPSTARISVVQRIVVIASKFAALGSPALANFSRFVSPSRSAIGSKAGLTSRIAPDRTIFPASFPLYGSRFALVPPGK